MVFAQLGQHYSWDLLCIEKYCFFTKVCPEVIVSDQHNTLYGYLMSGQHFVLITLCLDKTLCGQHSAWTTSVLVLIVVCPGPYPSPGPDSCPGPGPSPGPGPGPGPGSALALALALALAMASQLQSDPH